MPYHRSISQYRATGRHGKTPDFTGQTFGLWMVEGFLGYHQGNAYWAVRCACGTVSAVAGHALKKGASDSCGCQKAEISRALHTTHGKSYTPEHKAWALMKERCTNPHNKEYFRYAGRGITVCQRWLDSFEAFYADMGDKPSPKHTLERVDNNRGYEPGNVVWDTRQAQSKNRRSTIFVTHDGITLCLTDWAKRLGFSRSMVAQRMHRGASIEEALNYFKPL